MKTIFYKTILLFCGLIFFTGCDTDNKNAPPRDFEIIQVGHYYDKVLLRWTESTDPENSIVTYDIYIKEDINDANYRLVKGGLTGYNFDSNGYYIRPNGDSYQIDSTDPKFVYSYPILNLDQDKNWSVKIVAIDQDGEKKEKIISAITLEDLHQ